MRLGVLSLGQTGLEVSELGLGCVGMSELYGPREPENFVGEATATHPPN